MGQLGRAIAYEACFQDYIAFAESKHPGLLDELEKMTKLPTRMRYMMMSEEKVRDNIFPPSEEEFDTTFQWAITRLIQSETWLQQ